MATRPRIRVLIEALIAALIIGGAVAIRDSEVARHRTGAIFLLISGALFLTVAFGDWWRDIREQKKSEPVPDGPSRARRVRPATRP